MKFQIGCGRWYWDPIILIICQVLCQLKILNTWVTNGFFHSIHVSVIMLLFFLFLHLVVSFILHHFCSLCHPCFIPFYLSCCRIPFLFIMIVITPWLFFFIPLWQQVCSSCSSSTGQRTRQPRRNVSWKRPRLRLKEKLLSLKKPIVVKYGLNHVTYLIEQVVL